LHLSILNLLGPVILDASNIALRYGEQPRIAYVWAVVRRLLEEGVSAGKVWVIFDHGVAEKATDKLFLVKLRRVVGDRFYECPPGVDADDFILELASDNEHAVVVSNDRFLDKLHSYGDVLLAPRVVRFEIVRTKKGVKAYLLPPRAFWSWVSRTLSQLGDSIAVLSLFYGTEPALVEPKISPEEAVRIVGERVPWAENAAIESLFYAPVLVFWASVVCRERGNRGMKASYRGYYALDTITGHVRYLGKVAERDNSLLREPGLDGVRVRVILVGSVMAAKKLEQYLSRVSARAYRGRWRCRIRALRGRTVYLKPYYKVRYTVLDRSVVTYVDAERGEVFGRGLRECWLCHKLYPREVIVECEFCGKHVCPDCVGREEEFFSCNVCGAVVCKSCVEFRGVLLWRKPLCPFCSRGGERNTVKRP